MPTLKPQSNADHYTAIQRLVHWPLMGELSGCYIWYSEEGPGACCPAQSPPRCTKCNRRLPLQTTHQRPVYQLHVIRCGTKSPLPTNGLMMTTRILLLMTQTVCLDKNGESLLIAADSRQGQEWLLVFPFPAAIPTVSLPFPEWLNFELYSHSRVRQVL